ncbi:hypothetical protein ADK77_04710 [Streptomyces antibioticus]|nr:hypothetical protein ADK77_04710 [Streptomyces antibioticus]
MRACHQGLLGAFHDLISQDVEIVADGAEDLRSSGLPIASSPGAGGEGGVARDEARAVEQVISE